MKQDSSTGFGAWIKANMMMVALVLTACICVACLCSCSSDTQDSNANVEAQAVSSDGESADGSAVVGSGDGEDAASAASSDGESAVESVDDEGDSEEAASEEDYSDSMPFKGMSEKYISSTWMGEPDEVSEPEESGQYKGAVIYSWYAYNGDTIYSVRVFDGKVDRVSKIQNHTDYWMDPDDRLAGAREFPNLDGTGEYVEGYSGSSSREDPEDYSTPEEYADNAEDWFAQNGYDDPWDAAYEYWEENAL